MWRRITPSAVALVAMLWPGTLRAQIDYRNLDGHRPSWVEDAYPIERYAFELALPYGLETGPGSVHSIAPELAFGAWRNGSVGLAVEWDPFRSVASSLPRLWSRAFGFVNLLGESPSRPAVAVKAELGTPVDAGFGRATLTVTGLATRSFGLTRLHANAAVAVAGPTDPGFSAEPRWWAGVAVDRTLFRTSTLLVGEVVATRSRGPGELGWRAGIGLRHQLTPTLVVDGGVAVKAGERGGVGLTLGASHGFALASLLPGRTR